MQVINSSQLWSNSHLLPTISSQIKVTNHCLTLPIRYLNLSCVTTFGTPCFFFIDLDKFATDDIMDPIAKAKMVALKGIKRVLAQDPMVVPQGINRYLFLFFSFLLFVDFNIS